MIFSKVGVSGEELALSNPSKHFNLLKDKEVYPCQVVSSDEVLGAKELRDLLHALANFIYSVFVTRTVHVRCGSTLDITDNSKYHVNDSLFFCILA